MPRPYRPNPLNDASSADRKRAHITQERAHEALSRRREEAQERQEAWDKLSPQQQLDSLDKRGHAAAKQRRKIQKKLDESNVKEQVRVQKKKHERKEKNNKRSRNKK